LGEDVTISPGWERVRTAAVEAARDPWVWASLAGAATLQIDSWDRRVSDWAIRETPLYGSQQNAATSSDDLRYAALLADAVTILLAPGGDDSRTWMANKAKAFAVDLAAVGTSSGITELLKTTVGRTRPSGTSDASFPSGHTSDAATLNRLAARNLEYFDMTAVTRRTLTYGLDALTIATAWARVEAGAHYPSDTLVSIALGNYFANFFRNAFMKSEGDPVREIMVVPTTNGVMLRYSARF
jgi:membrane-associated phospholipid phosphatase